MMPLIYAPVGEAKVIRRIGGNPEVRKHLSHLGMVTGSPVTVVSSLAGNVIVCVKETRVAISKEMAGKIMV